MCVSLIVAENSHTTTNYFRVMGGQKENSDIMILQQSVKGRAWEEDRGLVNCRYQELYMTDEVT